jgi:CRP-like cAMP-binding protein
VQTEFALSRRPGAFLVPILATVALQSIRLAAILSTGIPNALIAAVPRRQRDRLLRCCEPFEMEFGTTLCDAEEPYRHAYFPRSGCISLVSALPGHNPLEVGLIGHEGMLGATLLLGIETVPMRAVVQDPGMALRISAAGLRRVLRDSPGLRKVLGRYLYLRLVQLSQTGACTRFHQIEPRLARWLLLSHDRAQGDRFHLTHEYLADMLGVRRSGVTVAAGGLQARRLIRYTRGEITILDRPGLEAASCGCYAALNGRHARLRGD